MDGSEGSPEPPRTMRREKSKTGLKSTQWPRLPYWTGESLWTSNYNAPPIVILLTELSIGVILLSSVCLPCVVWMVFYLWFKVPQMGATILKMLIHRVTPGGSPRLDLIGLGASAVTDGDLRSWIPQGGREHRLPVKIRELL